MMMMMIKILCWIVHGSEAPDPDRGKYICIGYTTSPGAQVTYTDMAIAVDSERARGRGSRERNGEREREGQAARQAARLAVTEGDGCGCGRQPLACWLPGFALPGKPARAAARL